MSSMTAHTDGSHRAAAVTAAARTTHAPNLRELHQRVLDMLHDISTSPPSTQTSTPNIRNIGHSQVSSSSRDSLSLSSLSPPTSPGSYNPSPRNSDLSLNSSKSHNEGLSLIDNTVTDRNNQNPDMLTLQLNRFRNETALSPISEGIPSRTTVHCPPVRGVSAAVSDESVAADSGVFVSSMENLRRQNSMRSSGQCSEDDGMETPQIKIGLGYVEEKEQLLVCIDEACSLRLLGACDGLGTRVRVHVLPQHTASSNVYSTGICKDLLRAVFNEQFFVSIPKVR